MRSLLSERDQRIVLILEILMANDWVSLTTITKYLDCSEKTIRNDLGLISTEFEEIIIESSPQQGYHLVRQNSFPIENTIDQIINNTLIFQLLQTLLQHSVLKLTELESLLFVSANSIRNVVKDFNHLLKPDNVSIKSRPFRIEGDEVKITSLFFIRLQQSYFSRGMVEDDIFSFIQELIPLLFADNPELETAFKNDRHSLNILLYIRFFREKNGHPINHTSNEQIVDYSLVNDKEIAQTFFDYFNILLTNGILNNVTEFILHEKVALNYLQLIYLFDHSSEYREISNNITHIMTNVMTNLNLPLLSEPALKELILPNKQQEKAIDYDVHLMLLEVLKYEQYHFLKKEANLKNETFYGNTILIQLAYFLQMNHIPLVDRLNEVNEKMAVTALLITIRKTSCLFKEYLDYHFSRAIDFTFIDSLDSLSTTDLLITNTYDYLKMDIPVLNVAGLPNKQLYSDIQTLLYTHRIQKYLHFTNSTVDSQSTTSDPVSDYHNVL